MHNFEYHNATRIVFGKETIARLADLVPADARVLFAFGGGSIRRNGVYDQVKQALGARVVEEFQGIEPNPRYETLMRAVELVREEKLDFMLAVGGGSVVDGVKFIAAAAVYAGDDPWRMMADHGASVKAALPMGVVLTLPATGSEMNNTAVVTRESTKDKLHFASPHVLPKFSILDPETTFSLPPHQVANGVVDAFVHVMEQYMTYPVGAALQDRQAEGILLTLIEQGPKAMERPDDYAVRANIMWTATQALNGLIGVGVPQDWATHMIGHEITALYGLDHAVTLAIVLPGLLRHKKNEKREKLLQYAGRVWGVTSGTEDERIEAGIARTEEFFRLMGLRTKLSEHDIPASDATRIAKARERHGLPLGERGDIGVRDIVAILERCA